MHHVYSVAQLGLGQNYVLLVNFLVEHDKKEQGDGTLEYVLY